MSFQPITENKIPEPPLQLVEVICSDFTRLVICARFAPNIRRKIVSYKPVRKEK
jgi:hypothetical protein